MSNKGWLSRADFDKLDELLGKLGYGGYYDFLQCLKDMASNIGAVYFMKGDDLQAWDLEDVKIIPEVMAMLTVWSHRIARYKALYPEWIDKILEVSER